MDRKEFLSKLGLAGCACCAAPLARAVAAAGPAQPPAPKVTADAEKAAWAKTWTKRFFDVLDAELDEATRRRVMEHNGRLCHEAALGGRRPQPMTVRDLVSRVAQANGADTIRLEGSVVYFNYVANPNGLRVADGYCLCPLVEDGPPGLSGTFCHCSVGYVKHLFETALGRPVRVDLLESLKRGGKACRFRVDVAEVR